MPEMDLASVACAIQNLWLAARAEGVGMGWVSLFEPEALRELLRMPAGSRPVAVLCLGYVREFYPRPMLEMAEWARRCSSRHWYIPTTGQTGSRTPAPSRTARLLGTAAPVDRASILRQRKNSRQVPLEGIERELGLNARAAPATVSGAPRIEGHWIDEIREGDAGTQNRKPGDLLVVVAHRPAGVC